MTGNTFLIDLDQKGVFIAIVIDLFYLLEMPRGLSLRPELLPRTGPETGLTLLQHDADRIFVHIPQHKHITVIDILDNSRDQPLIVKLEFLKPF